MIERAIELVSSYVDQHIDKTNPDARPAIFVVWQAKVLQNFKCLISVTLPIGMYFELTYDGDLHRWYMDAYHKSENRVIPDD